jgi:hypothetical protein
MTSFAIGLRGPGFGQESDSPRYTKHPRHQLLPKPKARSPHLCPLLTKK